ncbi:MAG: ABC transporter permease [Treponema sp.]|jgi:sulfonate transport system permease protein|nr:ABC transporter permease [Treponema sp.]
MKKEYFITFVLPVVFPLIIVFFWEYAGKNGLVSQVIAPSPSRIYDSFSKTIASGVFFRNLNISLIRVASGYALGTSLGIVCGIIVGLFLVVERSTFLIVSILRPIPMVALVPLFILFFGIGEMSKLAIIALGSFWPAFLNTQHGIKNVDPKLLNVAYVLRKSRWETLVKVIFPSSLPSIFVGARLGASIAWMCVVTAEMIAASSGLGYMVMFARETSQTALMYLGVLVIGLFGLFLDLGLTNLQKVFLRWNSTAS